MSNTVDAVSGKGQKFQTTHQREYTFVRPSRPIGAVFMTDKRPISFVRSRNR